MRNQHERTASNKHAAALREVNELVETIEALRAGLLLEQRRYQESLAQPQSVATMKNLRAGCDYYEQRIFETSKSLANAEIELEKCKTELTSARREREVMEKYKNRLAGAHAQLVDKADQSFMDELSLRGMNQFS